MIFFLMTSLMALSQLPLQVDTGFLWVLAKPMQDTKVAQMKYHGHRAKMFTCFPWACCTPQVKVNSLNHSKKNKGRVKVLTES